MNNIIEKIKNFFTREKEITLSLPDHRLTFQEFIDNCNMLGGMEEDQTYKNMIEMNETVEEYAAEHPGIPADRIIVFLKVKGCYVSSVTMGVAKEGAE